MSQRALPRRARAHLASVRAATRGADGENGSLLLAILLAVLVTSLIAAASITTIAAQKKTQIAQRYSQGQQSADAALADLLRYANQGGDPGFYDGTTGAKTRTYTPAATDAETTKWQWVATPTVNGGQGDEFDVAITTSPVGATKPVRKFKVHISAMHVAPGGASVNGNTISYSQTTGPNPLGFFADTQAVLRGNSRVDSYNSNAGSATTGNGVIGSNGLVTFSPTATSDRVTLWNFTAAPNSDRCTGARCSTSDVETQPFRLGGSGSCPAISPASSYPGACANNAPTKFIDQTCSGQDIQPWIASENGTTPTLAGGTVMCVSSLMFDRNTLVNASPSNPVQIYVTGHGTGASPAASGSDGAITVLPGVSVNAGAAAPISTNLLIYSKTPNVTLLTGGATDTRVAWGLWAPNADCGGQDPTGSGKTVHIYGAMTCSRISTAGTWAMHYDEQMRLLNDAPLNKAWFLTSYEAD